VGTVAAGAAGWADGVGWAGWVGLLGWPALGSPDSRAASPWLWRTTCWALDTALPKNGSFVPCVGALDVAVGVGCVAAFEPLLLPDGLSATNHTNAHASTTPSKI
jgi:hypothetical protein